MRSPGHKLSKSEAARTLSAAIFDVDGVLLASPHERAWREALDGFADKARFTTTMYQSQVAGKPRLSGALAALQALGVPNAEQLAQSYAEHKQRRLEALIDAGAVAAFPDAIRFVKAVRTLGWPIAVASSSKNANAMMKSIRMDAGHSLFDVFRANVCGRDLREGKPNPEIFLLAAAELPEAPANCFVIEDAPAGIEAACVPVHSLAELIALSKQRGGKIDFGSGGVGSPLHLAGEALRLATGIQWTHIPYKGAGPALIATITGEVQVATPSLPAALPQVEAGRLRVLAVSAPARLDVLPNVPTVAELGYPKATAFGWVGLHAPAGTPPAVIEKLETAIAQAMHDPTLLKRLHEQGAQPALQSAAAYGQLIASETARWKAVVQAAGIPRQ